MNSHIFAERLKIHIDTIHSHIHRSLNKLTDHVLSCRSAGKSFCCADILGKVINKSPDFQPLFMCL